MPYEKWSLRPVGAPNKFEHWIEVKFPIGCRYAGIVERVLDQYEMENSTWIADKVYKGTFWEFDELEDIEFGPKGKGPLDTPRCELVEGGFKIVITVNYGQQTGEVHWYNFHVIVYYKQNRENLAVASFADLRRSIDEAKRRLLMACDHDFKEISHEEARLAGHKPWGAHCHAVKCELCNEIRMYDSSG